MLLLFHIIILLGASYIIYVLGERFALASSRIGDGLKMSRSIKGATFDAIASSLPELLVALFAVIFFNSFEVGIGTIAGSALFNLLIIPGFAALVAPTVFTVSSRVVNRDAMFYVLSVFMLVVLVFYFQWWGIGIAIALLALYLIYVRVLVKDTKQQKEQPVPLQEGVSLKKEIWVALGLIVGLGGATFLLTESSMAFAEILDVSPVIIAFIVTAAATSVPDTVISVVNAKNGQTEDAASNVFGSNIFDICVALGLPLLIFSLANGPVNISFPYIEILFGLMGATIVVLYMLAQNHELTKKEGVFLVGIYVVFVLYVVLLSTGTLVAPGL